MENLDIYVVRVYRRDPAETDGTIEAVLGGEQLPFRLRFLECALPKLLAIALSEGVEAAPVQDIIRMFRLDPPKNAPENWP